jgi:hypothetical protein
MIRTARICHSGASRAPAGCSEGGGSSGGCDDVAPRPRLRQNRNLDHSGAGGCHPIEAAENSRAILSRYDASVLEGDLLISAAHLRKSADFPQPISSGANWITASQAGSHASHGHRPAPVWSDLSYRERVRTGDPCSFRFSSRDNNGIMPRCVVYRHPIYLRQGRGSSPLGHSDRHRRNSAISLAGAAG